MLKFFDCFAGIGGFHLAIDQLGIETSCIGACEYKDDLIELYDENFGIRPYKDILDLDIQSIEDHDLLCGGFPCQPFSNFNTSGVKGLKHDDGNLSDALINILKHKQPKYCLFENVLGLKAMTSEYSRILKQIHECKYHLYEYVLSPHQFGVPQHRPRLFIFGSKDPIKFYLLPKQSIRNRFCLKTLRSFLDFDDEDKRFYYITGKFKNHIDNALESGLLDDHDKMDVFLVKYHSKDPVSVRLLDHDICNTFLTTNTTYEIVFDPKLNNWRRLAVREAARLQSIDDQIKLPISLNRCYNVIGNAINVTVVNSILKAHLLGETDEFYSKQLLLC